MISTHLHCLRADQERVTGKAAPSLYSPRIQKQPSHFLRNSGERVRRRREGNEAERETGNEGVCGKRESNSWGEREGM